jgi:hypothetical protein
MVRLTLDLKIINKSFFRIEISQLIGRIDRTSILAAITQIDIVEKLRNRKLLFFIAGVLDVSLGEGLANGDFL